LGKSGKAGNKKKRKTKKVEGQNGKNNALQVGKVAQDAISIPAGAQLCHVFETSRQTCESKAQSKKKSEPGTPTTSKYLTMRQPSIIFQALDLKLTFCPMVAENSWARTYFVANAMTEVQKPEQECEATERIFEEPCIFKWLLLLCNIHLPCSLLALP
jgi:hypothetical protein